MQGKHPPGCTLDVAQFYNNVQMGVAPKQFFSNYYLFGERFYSLVLDFQRLKYHFIFYYLKVVALIALSINHKCGFALLSYLVQLHMCSYSIFSCLILSNIMSSRSVLIVSKVKIYCPVILL